MPTPLIPPATMSDGAKNKLMPDADIKAPTVIIP